MTEKNYKKMMLEKSFWCTIYKLWAKDSVWYTHQVQISVLECCFELLLFQRKPIEFKRELDPYEDFLLASFHEENYRKEFTDALRNYVDMGNLQ